MIFQGAHEELKVHIPYLPLSRATANTLYNDAAIGSTANKGIDMQGFDEALIVPSEGAIAAGAAIAYTATVADNNTANDATLANVVDADSNVATVSYDDTMDNTCKLIRIRCKDCKRFLFVKRVQTGAFAAVDTVTVVLAKAKVKPVTQDSTINSAVTVGYTHLN